MDNLLLAQWHIQCVRERLENDVEKADYIHSVNSFVRRIWVKKVEKDEKGVSKSQESPPMLEVADVENSTMTFRGATTDVIKLSIARPDDNAIDRAIGHFCTRVFELAGKGEISSKISQITDNSLLGVEPLSKLFRLYWTQGFLATFVHKKAPIFHSLANANIHTAWLRGMFVAIVAIGEKDNANLIKCIWAAVGDNLLPETRTPKKENVRDSDEMMGKFGLKAEELVRYMRSTSQRCAAQREAGSEKLPSDFDVELLNLALDILTLAFEVLTTNETIYKQWAKIVESANAKVLVASGLAGASMVTLLVGIGFKTGVIGGSGTGAVAAGATGVVAAGATGASAAGATGAAAAGTAGAAAAGATGATATTGAAGATLVSTMSSAAVMCPLTLFVASAGLLTMHLHFKKKASSQAENLREQSERIQELYMHVQAFTQWLVIFSKGPAMEEDGEEMKEIHSKLHQAGLDDSYTLADFQATLDSESEILWKKIQDMKTDPMYKNMFS